jgi:Type II secretion system (T2SS), protein E, N-terminal domain
MRTLGPRLTRTPPEAQDLPGYRGVTDHAGPLLFRAGVISQDQLHAALSALALTPGRTLVEQLVASGAVDEDRLCRFFHDRLLVPIIGAAELARVSRRALRLVPADMAAEFRCVPIRIDAHRNLALAMADPSDTHAVDEVQFITGMTVFRVAAPASAIAWAIFDLYGVTTPLAEPPADGTTLPLETKKVTEEPEPPSAPVRARTLPAAEVVEDVYSEDTPIPLPVPFDQTTGRVVLIDPRSLAETLAQMERRPEADPVAETALREAVLALEVASTRETIAGALVTFMKKLCRRAAFFVVRRGELAGWLGQGHGVRASALRETLLALDRPSTFRDIVQARLPYRGPVSDPPSRDFLIEGLGWAPGDMLAIPLTVRERVVGVLYGDETLHTVPDDLLVSLARAAELALERALLARKQP